MAYDVFADAGDTGAIKVVLEHLREVTAVSLMTDRPIAAGDKIVGQISRVIVGVDDSAAGLAAVAAAIMLARSYGVRLVAVRAWALGLPRHGGRRHRHLAHPHVVLSFSDAEQRAASEVLIRDAVKAAVGRLPGGRPR